jgi:hypothetical protein
MRVALVLVGLGLVGAGPAQAQRWQLPLVNSQGDTMYTQVADIVEVAPNVYRAWSKYVYAKPSQGDVGALVKKDYDCENGTRRVVFAVYYGADRLTTSRSDRPGRWIPVTREKGYDQWAAVCARARWGELAGLVLWIERLVS